MASGSRPCRWRCWRPRSAWVASQQDPGVAVRTVGGIEDIARQGLIELNRIVGALRRDEHEQLDRRPQPRLDDLPDLVDGARAAGMKVQLAVAGQPRALPRPWNWPPTGWSRNR